MSNEYIVLENSTGTITDQQLIGLLVNKWQRLLEGMPANTPHERYVLGSTALMYETQAKFMDMNEETRTANTGYYSKFIFPMLRRVFPNLFAHELVSVQPITGPQGNVFYMDYLYGSDKGQVKSGTVFPGSGFDRTYTSENITGEIVRIGDGTNFGGGGTAFSVPLAWTPVRAPGADGHTVELRVVNPATDEVLQTGSFLASGAFDPASDLTAGTINFSNGAIAGALFAAAPDSGHQIRAYYWYDGEYNAKIPEMRLDVKQDSLKPDNYRMKALWSAEAAEDLRALQGIEAETEILAATSQEMALEIDRIVINDLFQASSSTVATFDRAVPAGVSEIDHLRSMITAFSTVSSGIHKKTLRLPANWAVVSPEISALMEQLTTHGDYRPIWVSGTASPLGPADAPRPLTQHGQFGIYKAGTLQNKWVIYVDPFFATDFAMLGLKGRTYLEAGYIFAPYILMAISGALQDPTDGGYRRLVRSRFARKMLREQYYGQVRVLNIT